MSADTASGGGGSATSVRAPAQIGTMNLADDGSTASLELRADRPLVWTSFRNPEGDLVVELPNSEPAADLGQLGSPSGLVASVEVERLDDSDRPLTRLVVRTTTPSEHSLSGDGDRLTLELLPVDRAQDVTLAYQPVEEPPVEEVIAEDLPQEDRGSATYADDSGQETYAASDTAVAEADSGIPQSYGTPDAPQVGPVPTGVVASQLFNVDILDSGPRTVVRVSGDGELAYSTFRLENPERFVIDLDGVVNTAGSSTVPVSGDVVDQIRIGQFKPLPDAVTRVVFDLRDASVPSISRSADGLLVTFGGGAAVPTAVTTLADATMGDPPPGAASSYADDSAQGQEEPEPEPVEVVSQGTDVADSDPYADPPPDPYDVPATTPVPSADDAAADSVPTWTPPPPSAQPLPRPAVPVYQPASAQGDVSQFEAQNVDLDDQGRTKQERLLDSFGSLVVSRQEREYVGEPISMSLNNADLVETLRSFAKISDLNFVIQPGVRGTVTVELKSVPWDQAMEQILKINNLGMDIDGTIVRIAPRDRLRAEAEEERRLRQARQQSIPLRTVMRALSYAQAGAVARLLRSQEGAILSRRGNVQVDARTNTLIIRELPDNIDTVLAVIDNLDTPEPQVTIEARIVEATKNFSRTLGISWDFDFEANQAKGNTTGLQFPNNIDTDGGVGLLTGGANGFLNLTMGNILDTFQLNARLQVAEGEGLVN
ncbi:MAG: AMIN domain-containing protein, partial [Holophagales bacterium]|nr:AMIN domain-containing protein [Holophagales bacterium]